MPKTMFYCQSCGWVTLGIGVCITCGHCEYRELLGCATCSMVDNCKDKEGVKESNSITTQQGGGTVC